MKFCGRVFRIYCTVCGLLVTPVILAVALAHSMGVLPVHKIQAVFSEGTPVVTAASLVAPRVEPEEENTIVDHRLWRRRLQEMSDRVEVRSREVEQASQEALKQQRDVTEVSTSLAAVLSTLLSQNVEREAVVASPARFVDRLEQLRDRRARLPHLVQTVAMMEPKAVATLLSRSDEIDDRQASELLGALSPRKAAEVLAEMGKMDPERGARLIARLGSSTVEESRD